MKNQDATLCAQKLKAIGDETRIKILGQLFKNPACGTDIARQLGFTQAHIAHHLTILKTSQLIVANRQGRKVIYEIHPTIKPTHSAKAADSIDLGCCKISF